MFVATGNLHLAAGFASCLGLSLSACIQYAGRICKRKAHAGLSLLSDDSESGIDLPFALVDLAVTMTADIDIERLLISVLLGIEGV